MLTKLFFFLRRKYKKTKLYKIPRKLVIHSVVYKTIKRKIYKRARQKVYNRYKTGEVVINLHCNASGCDIERMLIKKKAKISLVAGGKGFCFSASNGKYNVQGKLELGVFIVKDVKVSKPISFSRHAKTRAMQRFKLSGYDIENKLREAARQQQGEYWGVHKEYKKPTYVYNSGEIKFVCVKENGCLGVLTVY